jgi:hypothetical protein
VKKPGVFLLDSKTSVFQQRLQIVSVTEKKGWCFLGGAELPMDADV